jgi:hypothetical protein
MRIHSLFCTLALSVFSLSAMAQAPDAPLPQRASIHGTAADTADAAIPAAIVILDGPAGTAQQRLTADDAGWFEFTNLDPSVAYTVTVEATGFTPWTSSPVSLQPGQSLMLDGIKLNISSVETTVVAMTVEQLGRRQVNAAEEQRVLGVIPNFYIVYDPHPVPLSAKLKYELAFKASTDAITIIGDVALAGIYQAADTPSFQQGWLGYGQRFGAAYAGTFTNIMVGGAVLPSLLHQDPRYFYRGTGSVKSRMYHALSAPFVCQGDNGHRQFNASSIGGDLISSSLSNAYFPPQDRGAGIVLSTMVINTGGRMANAMAQEFILGRFTKKAKPSPQEVGLIAAPRTVETAEK